jgi:thiazole synthase ThiGH ThiG subunit
MVGGTKSYAMEMGGEAELIAAGVERSNDEQAKAFTAARKGDATATEASVKEKPFGSWQEVKSAWAIACDWTYSTYTE